MASDMDALYFAYASNLASRRMCSTLPEATFLATGKLMDHKLEFMHYNNRWKGTMATIIPSEGSFVWGVVWKIARDKVVELDRKEGIMDGIYNSKKVSVNISDKQEAQVLSCFTYYCSVTGLHGEKNTEKRPSCVYKNLILEGAKEHCLPLVYIKSLEDIEDNGYTGPIDWNASLLDVSPSF